MYLTSRTIFIVITTLERCQALSHMSHTWRRYGKCAQYFGSYIVYIRWSVAKEANYLRLWRCFCVFFLLHRVDIFTVKAHRKCLSGWAALFHSYLSLSNNQPSFIRFTGLVVFTKRDWSLYLVALSLHKNDFFSLMIWCGSFFLKNCLFLGQTII